MADEDAKVPEVEEDYRISAARKETFDLLMKQHQGEFLEAAKKIMAEESKVIEGTNLTEAEVCRYWDGNEHDRIVQILKVEFLDALKDLGTFMEKEQFTPNANDLILGFHYGTHQAYASGFELLEKVPITNFPAELLAEEVNEGLRVEMLNKLSDLQEQPDSDLKVDNLEARIVLAKEIEKNVINSLRVGLYIKGYLHSNTAHEFLDKCYNSGDFLCKYNSEIETTAQTISSFRKVIYIMNKRLESVKAVKTEAKPCAQCTSHVKIISSEK